MGWGHEKQLSGTWRTSVRGCVGRGEKKVAAQKEQCALQGQVGALRQAVANTEAKLQQAVLAVRYGCCVFGDMRDDDCN